MANEAYISAGINAGELTAANTAYVSAGIFPLNSGPTREINVFDGITVAEDKTIQVSSIGSLVGSVCWGHDTDVDETNVENLSTWVGTGEASGSGDDEIITLITEQYMDSPDVNISGMVTLAWNKYKAGDDPTVKYKTTAAQGDLDAAEWADYTDQFLSLGWVRIRIEE